MKLADLEVKRLFRELQICKPPQINPTREIQVLKRPLRECCTFGAYHKTSNSIKYDTKILEFLDEPTLKFLLLHEEGHMRYYKDGLRFDDIRISIPEEIPITKRENEFNADLYATRIFLENYPDDPCKTFDKFYFSSMKCIKKYSLCRLIRFFWKFLGEEPHPSYDERMKNIKEFCEKYSSFHKKIISVNFASKIVKLG
jgi:hypothetical protein